MQKDMVAEVRTHTEGFYELYYDNICYGIYNSYIVSQETVQTINKILCHIQSEMDFDDMFEKRYGNIEDDETAKIHAEYRDAVDNFKAVCDSDIIKGTEEKPITGWYEA